jgi:acetamidase/formamidase
MPTTYALQAERQNLHGHFSRDLAPALTIQPGDSVIFEALEYGWHLEPFNMDAPNPEERRQFPGRQPELDDGHALTGPVAIAGARPGQTLAVRINAIQVGAWGACAAGGWSADWNDRLGVSAGPGVFHNWTLDARTATGRNQHGHTVSLRPFMGVMGVAPAEPGVHSTVPPRATGGNLDCKALVAGTTLYLPVQAPGALFSTGDGHAAQGDGEVSISAIECPVERVDLTFDLLDDFPIDAPVANTPAGWLAMGFHEDLNQAMVAAVEAMLKLIQRLHGVSRPDALALASVAADFHVTQVVNQVSGVHGILPHGAIR